MDRIAALFGGVDEVLPGRAQTLRRIAVAGAMTDALVRAAAAAGAELYLTGQVRQPGVRAAAETGIGVVAVGHARSEAYGLRLLAGMIGRRFAGQIACVVRPGGTGPAHPPPAQRPSTRTHPPVSIPDERAPARERALRQLDALSYMLDNSIRVPGTNARFGVDALVGLVPGFGDAAGALMSAYIVVQAARLGAPVSSLIRMLLNVGIEALFGAVPVLGDVFDAAFKANARNVALLRREIERKGSTGRASTAVVLAVLVALVAILGGIGWVAFMVLQTVWQAIT